MVDFLIYFKNKDIQYPVYLDFPVFYLESTVVQEFETFKTVDMLVSKDELWFWIGNSSEEREAILRALKRPAMQRDPFIFSRKIPGNQVRPKSNFKNKNSIFSGKYAKCSKASLWILTQNPRL